MALFEVYNDSDDTDGVKVSRVIRPVSPASHRRKLLQRLALALSAADRPELERNQRRDILAFIGLVLQELTDSVEETCSAWEKRSYYLKADRFRRDWNWVPLALRSINQALEAGKELLPAQARNILSAALEDVRVPDRLQKETPWAGAWAAWKRQQGGGE